MASFWSVVTLLGVWGFVLSTVGLLLKGFPARGVFDRSGSLGFGLALVVCFIVWMLGMANA